MNSVAPWKSENLYCQVVRQRDTEYFRENILTEFDVKVGPKKTVKTVGKRKKMWVNFRNCEKLKIR